MASSSNTSVRGPLVAHAARVRRGERVGSEGSTPTSATSAASSRPKTASAWPRSPAAASRRISTRWAPSSSGAWRTACRLHSIASAASPSRSARLASFERHDGGSIANLVPPLEHPVVDEVREQRLASERERCLEFVRSPRTRLRRSNSSTSTQRGRSAWHPDLLPARVQPRRPAGRVDRAADFPERGTQRHHVQRCDDVLFLFYFILFLFFSPKKGGGGGGSITWFSYIC